MNKLVGILITQISQVNEVTPFSNAVAFSPADDAELVQYLNKIDNRMVPVVMIDRFFMVNQKYHTDYSHELYSALEQSNHFGRIVFMFDEPMWRATRNQQPHNEVIDAMSAAKSNYPSAEIMHIEAYAELYNQYVNNEKELTLFYDADHIGFDCYGKYGDCGGPKIPGIGQFTYLNEINKAIEAKGSDAKLFLVPEAFTSPNFTEDQRAVIRQLRAYMMFFENNIDRVSGLGAFVWGDSAFGDPTIIGARNNDLIRQEVEESFPKLGKQLDEFRIILD